MGSFVGVVMDAPPARLWKDPNYTKLAREALVSGNGILFDHIGEQRGGVKVWDAHPLRHSGGKDATHISRASCEEEKEVRDSTNPHRPCSQRSLRRLRLRCCRAGHGPLDALCGALAQHGALLLRVRLRAFATHVQRAAARLHARRGGHD